MKKLVEWGVFSFFPRRCAYCDALIPGSQTECEKCRATLPRIEGEVCVKCGREKKKCTCSGNSNYFTELAAPFWFKDNVRKGLHKFKFRSCKGNAKTYSAEMAKTIKERFPDVKFDFITEVPVGKEVLKQRGYNQCSLLCRGISDRTGIPYEAEILKKIYKTEKQHGLNHYLRRGNLTGVFDSDSPEKIKGKTILLCDDISTSGETLNECSKMLWLYGAEKIYCVTAALTEMRGDRNVRNQNRH